MSLDAPKIPGWRMVRLIGQGGMGRVFLAHRLADGTQAAVKVLSPSSGAGAPRTLMQRFARETRIMRGLEHPGLPRLLDAGVVPGDDLPYLVSEYLEGVTLDESPDFGAMDERTVRGHLLSLLDTLAYLHGLGILHRDLKPANVFLTSSGRTVLLDLGLVHDEGGTRLTATGFVVGTLATLAPEQLGGAEATVRSDLYQLAATAWLALTKRPPRPPGAPAAARVAPLNPDPSRWPLLADFLRACLSPDPDLRPPDAAAARALLPEPAPTAVPARPRESTVSSISRSGNAPVVGDSRAPGRDGGRTAMPVATRRLRAVLALTSALLFLALVVAPRMWRPANPAATSGLHSPSSSPSSPSLRPPPPTIVAPPSPAATSSPAAVSLARARTAWNRFLALNPSYDPLDEECRTGERLYPRPTPELDEALDALEPLAASSPGVDRLRFWTLMADVLQALRTRRAHEVIVRVFPTMVDDLAGAGPSGTAALRRTLCAAWSQAPSWREPGRSFPGPGLEPALWRLASAEPDPSLASLWRVFLAGVILNGRSAPDDGERVLRTVARDRLPADDLWRFHYVTALVAAARSDVQAARAAYSRGIEATSDKTVRMALTRNLYVQQVNVLFGDATDDLQSTTGF